MNGFSKLRCKKEMKQIEFAEQLGISISMITKLERDVAKPSFDLLMRIKEKYPETDMNNFFHKNTPS